MSELVRTTVRLPQEILKAAQHRAIEEDKTFQDLTIQAFQSYLSGSEEETPQPEPTKARRTRAETQKKRMIVGLSTVRGLCMGLSECDASKIASVCSQGEIRSW